MKIFHSVQKSIISIYYKVKGATAPIYSICFDKISDYTNGKDELDREMFGEILKITNESVKLVEIVN